MAMELWKLEGVEITRLVRAREVSAVEVAIDALERMSEVNPRINAVVDSDSKRVLNSARLVDKKVAAGEDAGLMAGVAVTVKDNIDQIGYATTNGLKSRTEWFARDNNPIIDNLEKAGAVIIGRTNVPAYCFRWFTDNNLYGTTWNPHNRELTPGGSSGGAAAAVASGIGAIAHGSDIAGSIRYPAYACGIHGLKPGLGRVPTFNTTVTERNIGVQLMAVHGPLARSVSDLRLAYNAMSQYDARDVWWVPAPFEGKAFPRRAALCIAPGGIQPAPEIKNALLKAAKALISAGWEVEEVSDLPPSREAVEDQIRLWFGDGYNATLAAAIEEGDAGAIAALRGKKKLLEGMGQTDFSGSLTNRASVLRKWQQFLDIYSVILAPVSSELPFSQLLDIRDAESYQHVWNAQLTQIVVPYLGLPALTLSMPFNNATPVGIQLIANRFREDVCLAVAEELESLLGINIKPVNPV
ncbi:amidase family protein [Klebsiella michiganensis]|uniref:amidase family protein n=1 Tax=Klebsiella michiganensis TaxID=1134687 RepID=UPI0021C8321D|nr:amidase family protein [Klebsiella michiganensis]UXO81801.1 amidase family protein [Klebsiella michiganensis]